jgi:hypothetical protein
VAILVLTASISKVGPETAYLGNLAQYLVAGMLTLYLLVILAYARLIMDALAGFLLRHRSQNPTSRGSWGVILGYVIAFAAIIILVRTGILQRIILLLEQSAALMAANSIGTSGQGSASPLTASSINPTLYYYTVLIFLGVVVVSAALFFGGLRTAYSWAREDLRSAKSTSLRGETLDIVRKAAESLKTTGEYREVILRCYRQMCQVLSEDGFKIGMDETAREFSVDVSGKLKLGGDAVKSLTFLFEEARYSVHQMENDKRDTALNELDILERALTRAES